MHEAILLLEKNTARVFSLVLGSNHFFFCIFTRSLFLKVAKIFLFEGKASSSAAIFAFLQYFIAAQRNIPRFNFVYTGAAPY